MYKYVLNLVIKISLMFAQYFEYYAIILRGAVFLWTQCRSLYARMQQYVRSIRLSEINLMMMMMMMMMMIRQFQNATVTNHATASPLQSHLFLVSCTFYTIPILRIFHSENFYSLVSLILLHLGDNIVKQRNRNSLV